MTGQIELWLRPWARFAPHRRIPLRGKELSVPNGHDAPLFLYHRDAVPPLVDRKANTAEPAARMTERADASSAKDLTTSLAFLPLPLKQRPGFDVATPEGSCCLIWPELPERPVQAVSVTDAENSAAVTLMLRALAVWDRIEDVSDALDDPARLWTTLRERWTSTDVGQPRMDVIVRHAMQLAPVLDSLELRPRRILRRVQRSMPVGRIQELDRKAMLNLARLPGDTLAQKAGDAQRLSAVAREENFDTLENRVLRAYCELAHRTARQYLDRNRTRRQTTRARRVESYGKRCARLGKSLAESGVRLAEAGVTPNFVLQQNALYHQVWDAWDELRQQQKALDEVWRWQPRTWEEFCALALIVALMSVENSEVVATSPLWFRDESRRGHWVEADNPLAVVHLRDRSLIAEVRRSLGGPSLGNLGAPIWVRIGRAGETQGFQKNIVIWPLWALEGGLTHGEAAEIDAILAANGSAKVERGLVLRPTDQTNRCDIDAVGRGLCLTIGTEGEALRDCLWAMTEMITDSLGANV